VDDCREASDCRGESGACYGGDTLNTAIYLARLGASVDYVTALGDDVWSDEMLSGRRAEDVGTDLVVRLAGRVPGLYIIRTDENGERRFYYWRDSALARQLFALPPLSRFTMTLASLRMRRHSSRLA
jgi:2-dehydro-3-deoxygluconokinase